MIPGITAQRRRGSSVDPYFSDVSYLWQQEDSTTPRDHSNNDQLFVWRGRPLSDFITSAQTKFAARSLHISNSNEDFAFPGETTGNDVTAFNFGTADFAIDLWLYSAAFNTGVARQIWSRQFSSSALCWRVAVSDSGVPVFSCSTDGSTYGITASGPGACINNAWNHYRAMRSGSTIKVALAGVFGVGQSIGASAINNNAQSMPTFGGSAAFTGLDPLDCYIGAARVTKNQSRETSDFTPPTERFQTSGVAHTARKCTWTIFDRTAGWATSGDYLELSENSASNCIARGTVAVNAGKWYWEILVGTNGGGVNCLHGIQDAKQSQGVTTECIGLRTNGTFPFSPPAGVTTRTPTTYTSGDRLMFAFDPAAGKLWIGKNGTWMDSGDPAAGTNAMWSNIPAGWYAPFFWTDNAGEQNKGTGNWGQSTHTYSVPSGFTAGLSL